MLAVVFPCTMLSSNIALSKEAGDPSSGTSNRFVRRVPNPLRTEVFCRLGAFCSKSRRRAIGCAESRVWLDGRKEFPFGAMEDCRRGEFSKLVFLADRNWEGGRTVRLLRKIWQDVVSPGMEPGVSVSESTRECCNTYALPCISVDPDLVAWFPRLGGNLSADEKMPEIGSWPCSSYTPVSASVIPVFLCNVIHCLRAYIRASICPPSLYPSVVVLDLARSVFLRRRHDYGIVWKRSMRVSMRVTRW